MERDQLRMGRRNTHSARDCTSLSLMSKTLCSRHRRLYAAFCRGAPFKAEILRRGWTSCAVAPREGMERGHYVDIEVVAAAVCRVRGPVPTFEELDAVADLLRRPGNHRSVTQ